VYSEGRRLNHVSLTHQRSFHDDLNDKDQGVRDPSKIKGDKHKRTGCLGMLTPDTETPVMPQTTVSPDFL
jgi:hypothetical protein